MPPILAIDVGTSTTKAAILAPVEDRYRLVCDQAVPSRHGGREPNIGLAMRRVLRSIEASTGWRLLGENGRLGTLGELRTVAVSSLRQPVSIICLAADQDTLRALVDRVSALTPVQTVAAEAAGAIQGDQAGVPFQRMLHAIDGLEVGAIVVSAKSSREASILAGLLRAARLGADEDRLPLLLAAPRDIVTALEGQLPRSIELKHVSSVDWLHPSFDAGPARLTLDEAASKAPDESAAELLDFFGDQQFVLSEARSEGTSRLTALFAGSLQASTALLDIGGRTTTFIWANPANAQQQDRRGGRAQEPALHEADVLLGTGPGLKQVLDRVPLEWLRAWLPFDISDGDLINYLANRWIRGGVVPEDTRQLLIDMAIARECGLAARRWQELSSPELIIATGGIASYPRLGQSALSLLDILQPIAPCRLLVDRSRIIRRLGALVESEPKIALSVLGSDTLVNIGPCLSLSGKANQGETVAEVETQVLSSTHEDVEPEKQMREIRYGSLTVLPISSDSKVSVRLSHSRKFSFGLDDNRTRWSYSESSGGPNEKNMLTGGVLGIIVDARGRPLELSTDGPTRQALLVDWLQAIDAFAPEVFSRLD